MVMVDGLRVCIFGCWLIDWTLDRFRKKEETRPAGGVAFACIRAHTLSLNPRVTHTSHPKRAPASHLLSLFLLLFYIFFTRNHTSIPGRNIFENGIMHKTLHGTRP